MIDTHCHLDFEVFDNDRKEVIARAAATGVEHIVIPGVVSRHWKRISELCTVPGLHACYGLHPYYVTEHKDNDLQKLEQQLENHSCVAVGECGLDYRKGQVDRQLQLKFFSAQLDIAVKHNKPVVIHSVHATEDVIRLLKKHPGLTGMIHSYSGSFEQARQLVDMGFYISLGAGITYSNASKLHKVATRIEPENLLIETDAPDQPDSSHRGERNEPAYLEYVLQCLSELRSEPIAKLDEQTSNNARHLFQIPAAGHH